MTIFNFPGVGLRSLQLARQRTQVPPGRLPSQGMDRIFRISSVVWEVLRRRSASDSESSGGNDFHFEAATGAIAPRGLPPVKSSNRPGGLVPSQKYSDSPRSQECLSVNGGGACSAGSSSPFSTRKLSGRSSATTTKTDATWDSGKTPRTQEQPWREAA